MWAQRKDEIRGASVSTAAPASNSLFGGIRVFWLLILLCVTLSLTILPHFGLFLEDLQGIVFPLVLVAVFGLARTPELRIPRLIFAFALLAWALGAIHLRGLLPSQLFVDEIYISRLSEDPEASRGLYNRFNQIAVTYQLPHSSLIHRFFSNRAESSAWLGENPNAMMVVSGSPEWLRVQVSPRAIERFRSGEQLPGSLIERAKGLGYTLSGDEFSIRPPGTDIALVVRRPFDEFSLPHEPKELGRHFLTWFAAGLSSEWDFNQAFPDFENGAPDGALNAAARADAFRSASGYVGPWRTNAPRAFALFYLSLLSLQEAFDGELFEARASDCFVRLLRRASGFIQQDVHPEIYADVFNNVAVAHLLRSRRDRDFRQVKSWLLQAAGTLGSNGRPVSGAQAAAVNLDTLSEAGLIP